MVTASSISFFPRRVPQPHSFKAEQLKVALKFGEDCFSALDLKTSALQPKDLAYIPNTHENRIQDTFIILTSQTEKQLLDNNAYTVC